MSLFPTIGEGLILSLYPTKGKGLYIVVTPLGMRGGLLLGFLLLNRHD